MFQKIGDRVQSTAVAACHEWIFVTTGNRKLVLFENRPAFGYPLYAEYDVGRPIRDIKIRNNLLYLQVETEFVQFPIKEPITEYPQIEYTITGTGTRTITVTVHDFTLTLTDNLFRSRLLACQLFSYKNQVLAVAFTDSGYIMLWRLEDEAYLMKHFSGGPGIQENVKLAVLLYSEDEVRLVVGGNNGPLYESVLFEVGQSWSGMVPMVRDIGDKSIIYIEAEDEFDICA